MIGAPRVHVTERVSFVVLVVTLCWACATENLTPREIARRVLPSVVVLDLRDDAGETVSVGTGFFVAPGVIATSLHVIEGARAGRGRIVGSKTEFEIEGLLSTDRRSDLALLRVDHSSAPALPLAGADRVEIGTEVFVVSNPHGLEGSLSDGIVSGFRQHSKKRLIQMTAAISPGSSGAPVVDGTGKVVAVATSSLERGQNLNFAVPASYLSSLLSVPAADRSPVAPLVTAVLGAYRDREKDGLIGVVRSVDARTDPVPEDLVIRRLTSYDVFGNTSSETTWTKIESEIYQDRTVYHYDETRKLIKTTDSYRTCTYSVGAKDGEVVVTCRHAGHQNLYFANVRTLDEDGRLLESTYYGLRPGKILNAYSLRDLEVSSHNQIEYDGDGCPVVSRDSALSEDRTNARCDDQGRVIETASYDKKGKLVRSLAIRRDERGNPIAVTGKQEPSGTTIARYEHSYEYDSVGNWLRRITRSTTPGPGVRRRPEVTVRKITYY